MTKKPWTAEREAALAAKAEEGFATREVGPAVPNPLRKAGRRSLSSEGGTSKALNTRIPSDLHVKILAVALETNRSVSALIRDALCAFFDADATPSPTAKRPAGAKPSMAAKPSTGAKRATGAKRSVAATKRAGVPSGRTGRAAS